LVLRYLSLCVDVDEVFRNPAHIDELTISWVEERIGAQHPIVFAHVIIRDHAPGVTDDESSFKVDQVCRRQRRPPRHWHSISPIDTAYLSPLPDGAKKPWRKGNGKPAQFAFMKNHYDWLFPRIYARRNIALESYMTIPLADLLVINS
jgi:hypothetical protein